MLIDKHMKQLRLDEQKQLQSFVSRHQAEALIRELAHQILRIALCKGTSDAFVVRMKGGPMDEHRLADVTSAWKRHVTKTFKPGAESTWTFSEAAPGAPEQSEEQVYIPDASGADAPAEYLSVLSSGFVIGKRVMLLKRVTGLVQDEEKLKNEEELTRKDVQVEAMGTITDVPF